MSAVNNIVGGKPYRISAMCILAGEIFNLIPISDLLRTTFADPRSALIRPINLLGCGGLPLSIISVRFPPLCDEGLDSTVSMEIGGIGFLSSQGCALMTDVPYHEAHRWCIIACNLVRYLWGLLGQIGILQSPLDG